MSTVENFPTELGMNQSPKLDVLWAAIRTANDAVQEYVDPNSEIRYKNGDHPLAVVVTNGQKTDNLNPLGEDVNVFGLLETPILFKRTHFRRGEAPLTPEGLGLPPAGALGHTSSDRYVRATQKLQEISAGGLDRSMINALGKAFMVELKLRALRAVRQSSLVDLEFVMSSEPRLIELRERYFKDRDNINFNEIRNLYTTLGAMPFAGGLFKSSSDFAVSVSGLDQNDDLTVSGAVLDGYEAGVAAEGEGVDSWSAVIQTVGFEIQTGLTVKRDMAGQAYGTRELARLNPLQVYELNSNYLRYRAGDIEPTVI